MSARPPQLDGWVPIRVAWQGTLPMVDWCHLGPTRITEPFFEQTIEKALRQPFTLLFRHQTTIDQLCAWAEERPGLTPSGFIFHMSRCGSTLAAQLLARDPQTVVISEAPPIDTVLRAHQRNAAIDDEQRVVWLRAMVSALGQPRTGDERHLILKFDAWHARELPLIRRAFPEVPWVFIFRDPLEVLVSQVNRRAAYLVPGMLNLDVPGLDSAAAITLPPEEFCARVLSAICESAVRELGRGATGITIDYRQLPEAASGVIADHFGLTLPPETVAAMREAPQFDAKNPALFFTADTQEKQRAVSEPIRAAVERWLAPVHARLLAAAQLQITHRD